MRLNGAEPGNDAQVQPITRALAELQTNIVSAGVRAFDGWLERFIIYTLITRLSGLTQPGTATPISAHALALSLGRPYESVRRQVHALAADGLVLRSNSRIIATREGVQRPDMDRLIRHTHDSFVRFIEHLVLAGEPMPQRRAGSDYRFATGVQAAADIMLAVLQTNRTTHAGWLDLVLFSTVVAANCRPAPFGGEPVAAATPVSAQAIARAIGLGPATVSRHLAAMTQTGHLRRARAGYRVNCDWLMHPEAQAVTASSLQNVHRLLGAVAALGFPFDDPASAYLDGRPDLTPIG